jgi:hypothetical protein
VDREASGGRGLVVVAGWAAGVVDLRLGRLIAGRGSWEGALELFAELSQTRVGAGRGAGAATMRMAGQ